MRKQRKQIIVLFFISVFMAHSLLVPRLNYAGDEKVPKPLDPIVTILDEIYDIVLDTNSKVTPAPCTGAPVAKTGQTTSYGTGDDGELEKGVAWPNPRFTDNGNGTVTDNLTELIWLKNANCFGVLNWSDALGACITLASPVCGLMDGSVAGDWRLPNRKELESLMDFSDDVALPFEPPFANFGIKYWTSTSWVGQNQAWFIEYNGVVDATLRTALWSVWPVRGGN